MESMFKKNINNCSLITVTIQPTNQPFQMSSMTAIGDDKSRNKCKINCFMISLIARRNIGTVCLQTRDYLESSPLNFL